MYAVSREGIEVGRPELRISGKARAVVAVLVGHEKNNVGTPLHRNSIKTTCLAIKAPRSWTDYKNIRPQRISRLAHYETGELVEGAQVVPDFAVKHAGQFLSVNALDGHVAEGQRHINAPKLE